MFVMAAGVAAFGGPQSPIEAAIALLPRWLFSGSLAAVYLVAAAGCGRLWTPLLRAATDAAPLRFALGLGTLLAISHGLGLAGALGGRPALPLLTLALPAAAELVFLFRGLRSRLPSTDHLLAALPFTLGAVPLALACSPPGWLWASEFGGFDALSYHLSLPQEWLTAGRLQPLTTNVYSFLPSYFEAAFMHLGAILGSGAPGLAGEHWLTSHDGRGLIACQLLHAGTLLAAAWVIGRMARAFLPADLPARTTVTIVALVRAVLLLTPWSIIVGTLAYNEWPMLLLGAASLIAARDRAVSCICRAVLVAFLVGSACSVKPTALQFFAPAAALFAATTLPLRQWPRFAAVGFAVGLATLSPWLIRNHLATGNAVFPFASHWLGLGHWSVEQHTSFAQAHTFRGSMFDRFRLLLLADPSDPAGPRHRGMLHPQYGLLLAAGVIVGAMSWLPKVRQQRPMAFIALLMLAAWLFTTHLQSRFLMPLLVPAIVLLAGALAAMPRRLALVLGGFLIAAQAAFLFNVLANEHGGKPNQLLVAGPGLFTGEAFAPELADMPAADRARFLSESPAELVLNLDPSLRRDGGHERVLLIGDAAPLYLANATSITVWDQSPLASAMQSRPGEPHSWTESLANDGFSLALINLSELERYHSSRYADARLTPQAVASWASTQTTPIRSWPNRVLVRLAPPPPRAAPP